MKTLLMAVAFALITTSCGTSNREQETEQMEIISESKTLEYEIIDRQKSETSNKAQIKVLAYLKEDPTNKNDLEKTIEKIYNENKKESSYKNFSEPTVVAVYLFSSEKSAKESPESWVAMLQKGPRDTEPRISINDFKLNALSGLNDDKKSKDEIALDSLNNFLSKRNLELCSFSKQIAALELEAIHKADKKYPDYGNEHQEYAEKLMESDRAKLKKQYKLEDDILISVNVFAMSYCK